MSVIIIQYKAVKFNKCDTQFETLDAIPSDHWLTERVKTEVFQGYSRAYNITEYFRTRGLTSWKSGECVTGLYRTEIPGTYRGDRKTKQGRTLILFYRSQDQEQLKVVVFPEGYYPSPSKINQLIQEYK